MTTRLDEFRQFREKMNARILELNHLGINRFFSLDTKAYEAGAADVKTKELAGLSASLVLRCDDCIAYHVIRSRQVGASEAEIIDILNVGLIVGGSIVIPHLRRAIALMDELREAEMRGEKPAV
ncbi:MAG: carboxymuconolactone decarboxylase family protein [Phycisphaeraceae bacterium]|nr:carboxymuconolactone decarboxylase family protein [Phycisphaeraceae bacterium]